MRQQVMSEAAEKLREDGYEVTWVIDNAILSPGVENPDAEVVFTVNGKTFWERDMPPGDAVDVAAFIEKLIS